MTSLPVLVAVTLLALQCTATLPSTLLTSHTPSTFPATGGPRSELVHNFLKGHHHSHASRSLTRSSEPFIPRAPRAFPGERRRRLTFLSLFSPLSYSKRWLLDSLLKHLEPKAARRTPSRMTVDRDRVHGYRACLTGCFVGARKKAVPHIRSAKLEGSTYPPSLYLLGGAVGR